MLATAQSPAFSAHALARSTQRAIPPHAVELLLDYGATTRVRGADSYFLDRAGRRA